MTCSEQGQRARGGEGSGAGRVWRAGRDWQKHTATTTITATTTGFWSLKTLLSSLPFALALRRLVDTALAAAHPSRVPAHLKEIMLVTSHTDALQPLATLQQQQQQQQHFYKQHHDQAQHHASTSMDKLPLSPRPTSPFTPPATGEVKVGHGRRTRTDSGELMGGGKGAEEGRPAAGAIDMDSACLAEESTSPHTGQTLLRPAHRATKRARILASPSVDRAGDSRWSGSSGTASDEDGTSVISSTSSSYTLAEHAAVRDTPLNPFVCGGPADMGFSGPEAHRAHKRRALVPPREAGRMTYVFRGQRVTYADPYASDSDDDEEFNASAAAGACSGRRTQDQMMPRLLFPAAHPKRHGHDIEAPIPQPARSPVRKLLGHPVSGGHPVAGADQRCRNEADSSAPWLDPALAAEQDRLRRQAALCPSNRDLMARIERAGWDSDGDEAMDFCEKPPDARHRLERRVDQEENPFVDRQSRPITKAAAHYGLD